MLASLLYSFEFLNNFSEDYNRSEKEFYSAKKRNTEALNSFKDSFKNTIEFQSYLEVNRQYKEVANRFKQVKKNETFFGFKSFQLFAAKFFTYLALFIYFVFNLYRSFSVERKNYGVKFIHVLMIGYCFFNFYWIFQVFQDVGKPMYYLMTIFSAYFIYLALYIMHRQEAFKFKKLKKAFMKVSIHSIRFAREDKVDEMEKIIKESY